MAGVIFSVDTVGRTDITHFYAIVSVCHLVSHLTGRRKPSQQLTAAVRWLNFPKLSVNYTVNCIVNDAEIFIVLKMMRRSELFSC